MRIGKIVTLQTADTDRWTDNIYLSGCSQNCSFCFNKELQDPNYGEEMTVDQIVEQLSQCKWVAIMGGEPLEQDLTELIVRLREMDRYVIIFTSHPKPWEIVDADHYHIDIKPWLDTEYKAPPKGVDVSFGMVSYRRFLSDDIVGKLENIRDVRFYLKENVLDERENILMQNLGLLDGFGFKKIHYKNHKIKL